MTGKFNMDDYVDVAERIRQFYERHPEGSLQSGAAPQVIEIGGRSFIAYHAVAYRTADDTRPAHGWAWEPVPGPTQFTKDSELMNAETAAWGRAIVALGFETKKIASRQEVRNRQPEPKNAEPKNKPVAKTVNKAQEAELLQRIADIDTVIDALSVAKGNEKSDWIAKIDEQSGTDWRTDVTAAAMVLAKVRRWASMSGAAVTA